MERRQRSGSRGIRSCSVTCEHPSFSLPFDARLTWGRKNNERPLDCWKEVEIFKRSVSNLEADFVASLR
jgi:hypothetical protein